MASAPTTESPNVVDGVNDLLIASVALAFAACTTLTLIYLCWKDYTKFRITCLASNILLYPLSIAMLVLSLNPSKKARIIVPLHALAMAAFTTMLTSGLVMMGKCLRHKRKWKTGLFKVTILMVILYDITALSDVAMYLIQPTFKPEVAVLVAHLIFMLLTILFATTYAFFFVLTEHIETGRNTQQYIPVQAAAIGTWYLMCTGSLIILNTIITMISEFLVVNRNWGVIAGGAAVVLASCVTLSLALPPPTSVVNHLRRMIVGRRINHVTLLDRGVITSGLIEDRVYM